MQAAELTPLATPPDWSAIREEVLCPLCDYNLRGLQTTRCPECGYAFEWKDLLDPERRLHPYLFEHHPRRNILSFRRTLVAGLRPRRFWNSLLPSQPSNARRLVVYWLVINVLAMIVPVTMVASEMLSLASGNQRTRLDYLRQRPPWAPTAAWLDQNLPLPPSRRFFEQFFSYRGMISPALDAVLMLVAWPWATLLTLMIFRASMRKARIRSSHVLRCVLYSFDFALWVGLAMFVVFAGIAGRAMLTGSFEYEDVLTRQLLLAALGLLVVVVTYRMATAYRLYLKFDHPTATIIASQIIVVLAALIFLVNRALVRLIP